MCDWASNKNNDDEKLLTKDTVLYEINDCNSVTLDM